MTTPNRRTPRLGGVAAGQTPTPDRVYMEMPGLTSYQCRFLALDAVERARRLMPKITGAGAQGLSPIYGMGYFGIRWADPYVWWQDVGINPFTMRALAGKVVPMWINDPTGAEQRRNPKARIRRTQDGRTQVLIFRRAARRGQRKTVLRAGVPTSVPASYPGAPGRIARREAGAPATSPGRVAGAIARGNVGVRWRHPGLSPRSFLHAGMVASARLYGLEPSRVYATAERAR